MRTEFYTHLNSYGLLEMAEVGRFDTYKITVSGKEGPIPHFHFENIDKELKGCIRLDKPEYFSHSNYNDKLNSKDRKKMIEWLKAPHKSFGKFGYTNWQIICIYWEDNNHSGLFDENTPMPDYKKLK